MWHNHNDIARNRMLDPQKFAQFVAATPDAEDGMIHTWDVNRVVQAYREHIGEEQFNADRDAAIDKILKSAV